MQSKADSEGLREDLNSFTADFCEKWRSRTTSSNWSYFKQQIESIVNKNVPTKRLKGGWDLPWMTPEIKCFLKWRKWQYDAYNIRSTRRQKIDWRKYTALQDEIKQKIDASPTNYINGMFDDVENGSKRLWKYVKSLKRDSMGIASLVSENQVVTTAKEKAETLSSQYSSVFTKEYADSIPSKGPSPFPVMPEIRVTLAGVEKLFASLNPRKAAGANQVPTRILKEHAATIAPVLQIIFQQSLDTGDVPEDWRQANVTVVFKKGERSQPSNYRPVSLTCLTCKVLEHIISSTIRAHLDQHNILNDFQHGFRKHSCETQLLATLEALSSGIDDKQQIDCLILDFSKAFDVVAHRRVMYKLGW